MEFLRFDGNINKVFEKVMNKRITKFALILSIVGVWPAMSLAADSSSQDNSAVVEEKSQKKVDSKKDAKKNDESLPPLNLKTVLLNKPTREKIDAQRADYLNPKPEKQKEAIEPIKKKTGDKKAKKKPIVLPYKLSVTAVIKKPDGSALVRINDQYNQTKSKYISIDESRTGPNGAVLKILRKTQTVPVGQTLFPRQMKMVENYKIEQQEKKKALPKTKDKVTEDTLKQVQIITGE